jgi:hypothetical protein
MVGLKEGHTGELYWCQTRTCVLATSDGQWWWLYAGFGLARGLNLRGRGRFFWSEVFPRIPLILDLWLWDGHDARFQ